MRILVTSLWLASMAGLVSAVEGCNGAADESPPAQQPSVPPPSQDPLDPSVPPGSPSEQPLGEPSNQPLGTGEGLAPLNESGADQR
jgi:hypothetical protein